MNFGKLICNVIVLAALFTLTTGSVYSQSRINISGTVADSTRPLNLVTIHLFNQKDPARLLQTTYTKENGKFVFNNVDSGNYILALTHTGYAEKKLLVSVSPYAGNIELIPIQLLVKAGVLQEVSIKREKPLIEQADDKIIFNVEDDPASKTETAIDILRKTPLVTVDGEDNVQVNGQRNFKVLLNGRETSMFARNLKEALKGFPGALISKIEVITSPSAKYDGEGVGGVLNIITRKKVVGYNGSLSTFSRTMDKINNISINGNAKFGKIGGTLFYGMGRREPVGLTNVITTLPFVTTQFTNRVLRGTRASSAQWQFGNAELSWEIDSLNTLSSYANVNSNHDQAEVSQTITTSYNNRAPDLSLFSTDSENDNPGISAGTDYIKKFKKNKEREFTLRFFGEFGKSHSFVNGSQDNPGRDRYIVNNSEAKNNQYTIQTDYATPLPKNQKLEFGLKTILRRASSDFEALIRYDLNSKFDVNPANTDKFKYIQNVYSAYTMYSFRIKKTGLRIGGRVEHTAVNGDFITSHLVVTQSYTTLLPNIQSTTRIGKLITLVLSYNKRLARPYINDLNPFVFDSDSLDVSFGNPNLGPQTIHSLTAQTRYVKGTTFAALSVEGSYSGNKILSYTNLDPATGIKRTTSLNIGKEFQARMNMNLSAKITPKWDFFMNAAIRYVDITNNVPGGQSNQGFGGNFHTNNSYKFSSKFNISSFFGVFKDPVTVQTKFPLMIWYNVALNHKFLKEKLNISLRGVNFLEKTREFNTITEDINFYSTNTIKQIRRGIALALTYNFGKLSENVSRKKGVTNDDLLTRPAPTTPTN